MQGHPAGSADPADHPALLMWRPVVFGWVQTWILHRTFIPGLLVALAQDFYTSYSGRSAVPGLAGSMIMPFPLISELSTMPKGARLSAGGAVLRHEPRHRQLHSRRRACCLPV
jgi:hypothetical protein